MFIMVCSDFPIEQIESAITFYLKHNSEMPAPADIVNVILRGNKPPFDKSIYISITKKHAEDRTSEDWEYMREYEKFMITGKY